jgi:Protein of unknown function (DUF1800)/PA14 domain/CHRD domain/Putative Ig domain
MFRIHFSCLIGLGLLLAPVVPVLAHSSSSSGPILGLDEDKDGLSDLFEKKYPTLANQPHGHDADGDGMDDHGEQAAGTNPLDASERLDFTSVTGNAAVVQAAWKGVRGKLYQLQMSDALGGWMDEGPSQLSDGSPLGGTCPNTGERMFLRLKVSDIDSDGDGLTDWEEAQAGVDAQKPDTDGDGVDDLSLVKTRLVAPSVIHVIAADAVANEGGHPGSFRLLRSGGLGPITVALQWSGTATYGTDFIAPLAVDFGMGESLITLPITPIADTVAEPAGETVLLSVSAGTGYMVDGLAGASLIIQEPASGTGLTGNYFDNSALVYNSGDPWVSGLNFNPADLKETRVDGPIDFTTYVATNRWALQNQFPSLLFADADNHSIVWTGQVEPPVSGSYTFSLMANYGGRLWINGRQISPTSQWDSSNNTEVASTAVTLSAGQRVDIRLEYHDEAGNSAVQLLWAYPGQIKQVIPANRLYPTGYRQPSLTPGLTANPLVIAFVGQSVDYQIASTEFVSTYGAGGLPTGLSVNPATGRITGSTAVSPGLHFATITAGNLSGTVSTTLTVWVLPAGTGLARDRWEGFAATRLGELPLDTDPTTTQTLTPGWEIAEASAPIVYGERCRGWLTAPESGLYTFFLSTEAETAELWISADHDTARLAKRAWLRDTASAHGAWAAVPSQRSLPVRLRAGQRYYVETRRIEGAAASPSGLRVGWLTPGQTGATPPSVLPSTVLTPYDPAAAFTAPGTLYVAQLTPQGGAVSKGSGLAVLLIAPDHLSATLSYSYGGLTGPITNQHIHDGRSVPGPAGAILFDVDDAEPTPEGLYTWDFGPTGNHTLLDVVDAVLGGQAYLNLHTAAYPAGEIKGFFRPAGGTRRFQRPTAPAAASLPALTDAEACRFLMQASFGPKPDADGVAPWDLDSIEAVKALGYEGWIEAQLALPVGNDPEVLATQTLPTVDALTAANMAIPSYMPPLTRVITTGDGRLSNTIRNYIATYYNATGLPYDNDDFLRSWWQQAVTSPDQLRQRVAFALSQIFVISGLPSLGDQPLGMAQYYDILFYHGLGNFRTLLDRVTLSPAMGKYLDMMRNKKPDPTKGRLPNENYAREIMQLFSIGLKRVHPDGSVALDGKGLPVATYSSDEVVGLAHVFTGWTHFADNATFDSGSGTDYLRPMKLVAAQHALGEKNILDNTVINAAATTADTASINAELAAAHEALFQHPNVGPFIARQLIQRLVTANPSPGYIYRTALVFDDNGQGVRGDMAALVRAILLDPEARGATERTQPGYGHLREPVLRTTGLLRALRGYSLNSLMLPTNLLPLARTMTTTNIDLAHPIVTDAQGLTFVEGQRLWAGMKILLAAQTLPAENGLYDFPGDGGYLVRSPEADTVAELAGKYVRVQFTAVGNTVYQQTGTLPGENPWSFQENDLGFQSQTPLFAPTVFNFYEPDYVFPGQTGAMGLYGPEFQILSEKTILDLGNYFYILVGNDSTYSGIGTNSEIRLEFSSRPTGATTYPWPLINPADRANAMNNPEIALAHDPAALIARLNLLLLQGRMSVTLRDRLITYLTTLPVTVGGGTEATQRRTRVRDAVYLISLSHEFSIQK